MIWRTRLGRLHDRFGTWHAWFAWHPVTLTDELVDGPVALAWLCKVARLGVVVRGRFHFIYARLDQAGLVERQAEPPPAGDNVVPMRKARR